MDINQLRNLLFTMDKPYKILAFVNIQCRRGINGNLVYSLEIVYNHHVDVPEEHRKRYYGMGKRADSIGNVELSAVLCDFCKMATMCDKVQKNAPSEDESFEDFDAFEE